MTGAERMIVDALMEVPSKEELTPELHEKICFSRGFLAGKVMNDGPTQALIYAAERLARLEHLLGDAMSLLEDIDQRVKVIGEIDVDTMKLEKEL